MSQKSQPGAPPPLVPTDADLRGMPFMPLHTSRLMDSDLWGLAPPLAFKAAVGLWCKAWAQVPAGSIPNVERPEGEKIVRGWLNLTAEEWAECKAYALRGFVACNDGRLYHRVVCEAVAQALPGRREYAARKSDEAARKTRERNDRRALLGALTRKGVTVDPHIKTGPLRDLARDHGVTIDLETGKAVEVRAAGHDDVTRDKRDKVTQRKEREREKGTGREKGTVLEEIPPTPDGVGLPPSSASTPFELTPPPGPGTAKPGPYTPPTCPHERILEVWAEVMPELLQHDSWQGQRSDHLRARWREKAITKRWASQDQGVDYIRRLLQWCRSSTFLMGKAKPSGDRPPFSFTLAWLVRPNNWAEVIEGKFHHPES